MSNYERGFIDGVSAFAWWKDGKQHVGTTGTLLAKIKADPRSCFNFQPSQDPETVDLEELSIGDLVELINDARVVARDKQSLLRASGGCACHISPPCAFCVEGGNSEIP